MDEQWKIMDDEDSTMENGGQQMMIMDSDGYSWDFKWNKSWPILDNGRMITDMQQHPYIDNIRILSLT